MLDQSNRLNRIQLMMQEGREKKARKTLRLWDQVDKARMKMAANDQDNFGASTGASDTSE